MSNKKVVFTGVEICFCYKSGNYPYKIVFFSKGGDLCKKELFSQGR